MVLAVEAFLVVTVIAVFVSQIFIPAATGRPIFPILRRERVIRADIAQTRQTLAELELQATLEKLRTSAQQSKEQDHA